MTSKHKISQNDLRKFMSLHKQKLSGVSKKIESPLAKYLPDGTLKCIICDTVVRSEAVWPVHINAKLHKENIAKKKQKDSSKVSKPSEISKNEMSFKRPSDEPPPEPKKLKSILKNGSTSATVPVVPPDFFDSIKNIPKPIKMETSSSLDEINDTIVLTKGSVMKMEEPVPSTSDLPEGFFDNPLLDAKARNVEYKDPVEEEWERFQKEMKEEVTLSSKIIEDESETATVERQILEVDEQMNNWCKVVELEKKRENLQTTLTLAQNVKKEESDSDIEEDLEEFVSWRNKNSFR